MLSTAYFPLMPPRLFQTDIVSVMAEWMTQGYRTDCRGKLIADICYFNAEAYFTWGRKNENDLSLRAKTTDFLGLYKTNQIVQRGNGGYDVPVGEVLERESICRLKNAVKPHGLKWKLSKACPYTRI